MRDLTANRPAGRRFALSPNARVALALAALALAFYAAIVVNHLPP